MGANTFYDIATRKQNRVCPPYDKFVYEPWPDAKSAFEHLADQDRYENGHSYSGGIGMKHDFVHIDTVDTYEQAETLAYKLIEDGDARIRDKWGPAGCITIREGDEQFLFFGWASS